MKLQFAMHQKTTDVSCTLYSYNSYFQHVNDNNEEIYHTEQEDSTLRGWGLLVQCDKTYFYKRLSIWTM